MELFTAPIFSADGSKFLLILSQDQGNSLGSYRHLCLVNREASGTITALTKGTFVVTEILAWDENNDLM